MNLKQLLFVGLLVFGYTSILASEAVNPVGSEEAFRQIVTAAVEGVCTDGASAGKELEPVVQQMLRSGFSEQQILDVLTTMFTIEKRLFILQNGDCGNKENYINQQVLERGITDDNH